MTYLRPRLGCKPEFLFLSGRDTCLPCYFRQASGRDQCSFTHSFTYLRIYAVIARARCQALGALQNKLDLAPTHIGLPLQQKAERKKWAVTLEQEK